MFVLVRRIQRRHENIPEMDSRALRVLATKSPLLYGAKVLDELLVRDEDTSFALPLFYEMAIDKKLAHKLIGWGCLRKYFSDQLANLDLTKDRPSENDMVWIQSELHYLNSQHAG